MAKRPTGSVLVVGGGIAGTQAALDLADQGFKTYVVEKSPSIGGVMAQLDKTFPTNDCSMCILAPKLVDAGRHPNIELRILSEVTGFKGKPGNFQVELTRKTLSVIPDKCTGCNDCAEVCPVEGTNPFDENIGVRKAIYVPFPQAVPLVYSIDRSMCIGCGECKQFCKAGAIEYEANETVTETVNVGSVVLCPGFDEFDPSKLTQYGYRKFDNVVNSIEFERMMSASGPIGGHIVRPSDGRIPKKVAFLHCIGSRDSSLGITYCSSVCCMYSLKEAIIAQEHTPGLKTHLFAMDFRATGKQFEDYRIRAEEELGVKITRNNRIGAVHEDPDTNDLTLRYIEDDKIIEETYDMVVLGVGLRPPANSDYISRIFGVDLNEHGFAKTSFFKPHATNVDGVYVAGAFAAPKDIPDTVAEASGAAARAAGDIATARGTLVEEITYPEERDVAGEDARIGVFVCHCGINIGGIVDVPAVVDYIKDLPNVVLAEENLYTCSADTNVHIAKMIEEHNLNRILVASCTPRTHEPLFRDTLREAGLNPYLFEMANIRDHCSWIHMNEPEEATQKAKDLVRMTVAKVRLLEPLDRPRIDVTPRALVIGGGLSGMVAALETSRQGFEVDLVEKTNALGGNMRRVTHSITGDDPDAFLKETIKLITNDPRITLHTGTEIETVHGYMGNFDVMLKDGVQLKVGAIVVASGGVEYEPKEYMYGKNPNVMTQLELEEEMTKGAFSPNDVVIIQCVGARDEEHPNCSRICCTTSIKNAIALKRANPDANIYVVYKDIRTYGFREDAYLEAARLGIVFLRYNDEEKPKLSYTKKGLVFRALDRFTNTVITVRPDLVVLNAATHPDPKNSVLAKLLKVPLTKDGFFLEAHMKLRPVEFATDGIFVCGLALGPRFISESISQAVACAGKVAAVLSKEYIEAEGNTAEVDADACTGCGTCVQVCPYGAIERGEDRKAVVTAVLCKGCGTCVATCPERAIDIHHFSNEQLYEQAIALLKGGETS
jgi:heterodisulfide reductase subunit A